MNEKTQTAPFRFAIIGAGMSGILVAIKLKEVGFTDFTIYEKAEALGGTWRDNTYPGLSCDVPSHVYSYSFEPNPNWSHVFSEGAEIYEYFQKVAEKHQIDPYIKYESEIIECCYKEGKWEITTKAGEKDIVDFVISATGVLHHPNYPDIEGLETFAGSTFHSARWDHSVSLENQRVGIIGTGSTAIQIVTAITNKVKKLSLFQRTAQWVFPQDNPAYSEVDKAKFQKDPELLKYIRSEISKNFARNFSNAVVGADSKAMHVIEEACLNHLEEKVKDPKLLEKLRPDYRAACKRLIIADGFYEAVQKPNAALVTEKIQRIEPEGVRTVDGILHEQDVLVLATGFHPHQFMRPMEVIGYQGVKLSERWQQRTHAYRSVSIPDFPNFFMMVGPHSPIGNFSLIEVAELQINYIMQLINLVTNGNCRGVMANEEATADFNQRLAGAMKGTIWVTGCNSWYLDGDGIPATWPWNFERFIEEMEKPVFEDFELLT